MDFIITSIYNLKMPLYSTNGEIFGNYFAYFSIVTNLIIIYPASIMIIFLNKKILFQKNFEERWSILYEGIKRESTLQLMYMFVYLSTRLIFICIIFYIKSY
jgi:hypothetical protein